MIFPVRDDGTLDEVLFADAGGAGPFYIAFLNRSCDTFLNGVAVGDGVLVSRIDGEGRVTNGPSAPVDTSLGKPSELCWLQVTSDNLLVLATNFGYGNGLDLPARRRPIEPSPGPGQQRDTGRRYLPRRERARQQRTQRQLADFRRPVLPPDLWKCLGACQLPPRQDERQTDGDWSKPDSLQQPPGPCGILSVHRRSAIDQARSGYSHCDQVRRTRSGPGLVTRPIEGLSLERELVIATVSGSTTPVEIRKIAQPTSSAGSTSAPRSLSPPTSPSVNGRASSRTPR